MPGHDHDIEWGETGQPAEGGVMPDEPQPHVNPPVKRRKPSARKPSPGRGKRSKRQS
jgi:hypothetical protein